MSKAEERALEYYPNIDREDYPCKELDAAYREVFVLGYRQAEKDLELTCEDIKKIDKLLNQCVDYRNPYQEVLKRFKEIKEP